MMTASQIVTALGGTSAVATELGLTPSTVSSWKTAGSIPKWRRGEVDALAKRLGVDIANTPPAKPRANAA